ncbi:hypothetical protein JXB28_00710 [Candidatus Woesearchaeota archaeon]|nr:hypothetical protein [Candidatus Woesearchaeota archaeon]
MLKKDNVWTWSINCNNTLEDKLSEGKWIVTGSKEQLSAMFQKINVLVEQGRLYKAKYSHKENPAEDLFADKEPIMVVYANDKTKEKAKQELARLGLAPSFWKYEWESKRDWMPGGKLYQEHAEAREKKITDELLEYWLKQKDI